LGLGSRTQKSPSSHVEQDLRRCAGKQTSRFVAHAPRELAESVHLWERTIQRRFHRATRLKLTEYLQNVRITKARLLLEPTNGFVEGTAWAVGR